jgi:leader peptidase (prepilin peptidase)/N-methyltransferase
VFALLPDVSSWLILSLAFGFGAVIGSFLNVLVYRLPADRSLGGRSRCPACDRTLLWYELIPLLSFAYLGGRCRTCGSTIAPRYPFVEALTGGLFALTVYVFSDLIEMVLMLAVVSILVAIAVYDFYHLTIPDKFTLVLVALALAREVYVFAAGGALLANVLNIGAALGGSLFFYLLWRLSRGAWVGFGDVKLVFPLGLLAGAGGVFSMIVLSFWIGAAISLFIILLTRLAGGGKLRLRFLPATLTMKSAVPFAPFLIAGCLVYIFFSFDVLVFMSGLYA